MLFVSAGGSSAPADVVGIGDTAGALHVSLAKFELCRARCYDPNEVCISSLKLHLHLLITVLVATGTEAEGGHRSSSGRGDGVRASDPRDVRQPRRGGADLRRHARGRGGARRHCH
jgi:hypothetical protein